jgi:tetratricopeptide (TPR) repeat protein
VVNNQGVAESRAGRNAAPFYIRAAVLDPTNEDYVYNLAVTLRRNGDLKNAQGKVDEALKMKAADGDATALKLALQAVPQNAGADKNAVGLQNFQPLERIERTWQEASYRQAAFELEQMRTMRLGMLPAAEQSAQRVRQGEEYLGEGLTLEAEQEFQAALAVDPKGATAAEAHAGMAAVRAQNGSLQEARSEAMASLNLRQNVNALLVLAKLDIQANQLDACAEDVRKALQLEPKNAAVLVMQQALALRGKKIQ